MRHLRLMKSSARVLVCGAPERAERAASYLQQAERVSANREYHTYRGQWNGVEIQITSHGVGASGATIGFQELVQSGARAIVRVGTAGSLSSSIGIGHRVVATGGVRQEGVSPLMVPIAYPAVPDFDLTQLLWSEVQRRGGESPFHRGIVLSSDVYYPGLLDTSLELYSRANVKAVEMECSALFVLGTLKSVATASILSIDGSPLHWESGEFDAQGSAVSGATELALHNALDALARWQG